jgi:hypothetical protein
MSFKNFMNFSN